jgi:hypothetical protein
LLFLSYRTNDYYVWDLPHISALKFDQAIYTMGLDGKKNAFSLDSVPDFISAPCRLKSYVSNGVNEKIDWDATLQNFKKCPEIKFQLLFIADSIKSSAPKRRKSNWRYVPTNP